ncbi:hypothetical protein F4802DRAFT_606563 [Xylaria palmicola]|nr:hypothetical protein F4802DRAFT_606563 [Xylaria palmicola]
MSPACIGPGRPLLFPCRITRNIFFSNKQQSFESSALLVGVPVGWSGVAGGLVSVDCQVPGPQPRYTVDAADHLLPGSGHLGLRGKLDMFLTSQNIELSHYPYAYLWTDRLWLQFSMITELRSSVAKRQLHFLIRDRYIEDVKSSCSVTGLASGSAVAIRPIDPLCSLHACNPLSPGTREAGMIDSAISLKFQNCHAKLFAQVVFAAKAVDPTQLSLMRKLLFMLYWWWIRFASFPRVVKEAAILLFDPLLDVCRQRALLKEVINWPAGEAERKLKLVFRNYLRHLVKESSSPLSVRYVPYDVSSAADEQMLSTATTRKSGAVEHLEFKVLSSEFYTRFVFYAHDFEAIFCEFNENRTVWLSEPTLLPKLVLKRPLPPLTTISYLDYGYFTAIKKLRRLPRKTERTLASTPKTKTQSFGDIRDFRLSPMDGYVLAHEDDKTRRIYRSIVLELFIAD